MRQGVEPRGRDGYLGGVEATVDHYATLGVDARAEAAAIRIAYRNLMRRYHPDVNASDEAAIKATEINAAYACLSDPDERAHYDRIREAVHARPSFTQPGMTPPPRPHRSSWQRQHAYMADLEGEPPPAKWKFVSLGLATVITIITFKITSEISGVVMAPSPPPMSFVQTAVPAAPEAATPDCARGSDDRAACAKPKVAAPR